MLKQDKNFYLIHLSILITCFVVSRWILLGGFVVSRWILLGEVTCESLWELKG